MESQTPEIFATHLERGLPLYSFNTLSNYVKNDLQIIDQFKPDIVIGDFRLSLSVSARLRKIPYITICDAYWSPEHTTSFPVPVLKFTKYLPTSLSQTLFRFISPLAFRIHALPFERLRAKYRLPSLRYDLRKSYTDADLRLFANFPELYPDTPPGEKSDYLGPIAWSPMMEGDFSWLEGPQPLAYITMGSSGDPSIIKTIIPILESKKYKIAIASAGKKIDFGPHGIETRVFSYLPGALVCSYASLVICNGGSPTTNQALSAGVPVIGITRNMDQFLNMEAIVRFGAGIQVRGDKINSKKILDAVEMVQNTPSIKIKAQSLIIKRSAKTPAEILTKNILHLTNQSQ